MVRRLDGITSCAVGWRVLHACPGVDRCRSRRWEGRLGPDPSSRSWRAWPYAAAVRRPGPEVDRPGSYPCAPIPQVCHGRHELEEQLAGEEDEDEPAPGPTKGIRV